MLPLPKKCGNLRLQLHKKGLEALLLLLLLLLLFSYYKNAIFFSLSLPLFHNPTSLRKSAPSGVGGVRRGWGWWQVKGSLCSNLSLLFERRKGEGGRVFFPHKEDKRPSPPQKNNMMGRRINGIISPLKIGPGKWVFLGQECSNKENRWPLPPPPPSR